MKRRFVVSDHHFNHDRIYSFTDRKRRLIRPWAKSAEEGDEMMVEAHNSIVRNQDTVYFGGDVAIKARGLELLRRMNGRKVLIRGNHDIFRLKQYSEHFADIRGTHKIDRLILSHYPLHRGSIPRWCKANIHGHTHGNDVTKRSWFGLRRPDPLYINVCIEKLPGLAPLDIEEILDRP